MDHIAHRADFRHPPCIEHRHPVAGFGDHAHVVRHQHHRCAVVFAQAFEQGNDLRLDRHIQRCGGFVGHDQLRLGSQGQGDDHPLAHATTELVRVLLDALFSRRDARFLQQPNRALAGFFGADRQVGEDGFGQLAPDGVQRVQRGQRVLKDGADLAATDGPHLLVGQVVDALAGQANLPASNAAGRLQQADDGRTRERLAGARFTHHAQDFTRGDVKGDVIQRQQGAAPGGEFNPQVLDFEQGRCHRVFWVGSARHPVRAPLLRMNVGLSINATWGSAHRAASRPAN